MQTMTKVKLIKLGLQSYLPTWRLQQKLLQQVKDKTEQNALILVEHHLLAEHEQC